MSATASTLQVNRIEARPALLEHSFVVEGECHGWRLDRFTGPAHAHALVDDAIATRQ